MVAFSLVFSLAAPAAPAAPAASGTQGNGSWRMEDVYSPNCCVVSCRTLYARSFLDVKDPSRRLRSDCEAYSTNFPVLTLATMCAPQAWHCHILAVGGFSFGSGVDAVDGEWMCAEEWGGLWWCIHTSLLHWLGGPASLSRVGRVAKRLCVSSSRVNIQCALVRALCACILCQTYDRRLAPRALAHRRRGRHGKLLDDGTAFRLRFRRARHSRRLREHCALAVS